MKKLLCINILIFSMLLMSGCASINPLFQKEADTETQVKTESQTDKEKQGSTKKQVQTEKQSEKQTMPQSVKNLEKQAPKSNPALKNYAGVTKAELAKAVENVLYLMDPTDAKIVRQNDEIINYRYYSDKIKDKYIFGYDTWVVTITEQKNNSFDVAVMVGIAQDFSASAHSSIQPKTPAEMYFKINALDEAESMLFFERIDYFLGKNQNWRSCENIQVWVNENNYQGKFQNTAVSNSGDLPFICGHNWYGIEDKTPDFLNKEK